MEICFVITEKETYKEWEYLRDSGPIEQDAHMVMFLYRDNYYDAQSEDAGLIEISIAKHRNRETGIIKAKWYGKYQKVVA